MFSFRALPGDISKHSYLVQEIMKVRGFQVAPAELEGHLLLHPDVADVCVVGIPDEYSGEVPLAFVVRSVRALERTKNKEAEVTRLKRALQKVRVTE